MAEMKETQRQLASLQSRLTSGAAEDMLKEAQTIQGVSVLAIYRPELEADALRQLGDSLKEKLGECVLVLAGGKEKLVFVAMATDGAIQKGAHAGSIVKAAAAAAGGGGGGRPNMAQAGGKDASKVQEALTAAKAEMERQLKC